MKSFLNLKHRNRHWHWFVYLIFALFFRGHTFQLLLSRANRKTPGRGGVWVVLMAILCKQSPSATPVKSNAVGIRNLTIQNPETFEIWTFKDYILNGPYFKGYSVSPNHSKTKHFCPDFKWFMTKLRLFVWILKYWAARFQVSFKFRPFANQPFYWIVGPEITCHMIICLCKREKEKKMKYMKTLNALLSTYPYVVCQCFQQVINQKGNPAVVAWR